MKNFILPFLLIVFSFSASGQTWYFEDFASVTAPALGANQAEHDNDGDGETWYTGDLSGYAPFTTHGTLAISRSWNGGVLTPDNLLIIGPIDLSSASGNVNVQWECGSIEATSSGWHEEYYDVIVTTSNVTSTIIGTTPVFGETLPGGQTLYSRSVDISSMIGQSAVYVTFRHWNCTDENILGLDNIGVLTLVDDDAGVSDITTSAISLLSSGSQLITGEITNYGGNAINSVDVNYTIDGGATNTHNLTGLNIAAGGTYNFSHSTSWTPSGLGCYDLEVWTSNVNGGTDANPSNDNMLQVTSIVNQMVSTLPLYENFTSNTCGPCASFNPGFQSFINSNSVNDPTSASVANIKYQMDWPGAADQSWNNDADSRRGYYGVTGIPDHYIDGEAGNYSQSELNAHAARPAYMSITATTTEVGNTLTVDVTVDPIACYGSSNLTLHIAVTEDSYTNTAGSNGETEFHQVMRKMLPNANGTALGPLTAGVPVTLSESYTFTVGGVAAGNYNLWNGLSNTTVIVFVQDDDTKQILQTAVGSEGCGSTPPSVTSSSNDASCSGNMDGSIDLTVSGGTTPYTFLWSNGETSEDITNLASGTYTVTITDANGCITNESVTVNDGSTISMSTSATDANCGASDGTATATATGGASPYGYAWDAGAGNQTTQTATGLAAGSYSVTATDANGCTSVGTVTVNAGGTGPSLTTSTTDVLCYGDADGTATVSPSGGTAPYTYEWSNGNSSQTATGLVATTYMVTVTDASGCSSTSSVTITEPTELMGTTSSTQPSCGATDGTATVSVTGGTSPYVYAWSDGQSSSTATGLGAGSYTVTITDANNCTLSEQVNLSNAGAGTLTNVVSDVTCNGFSDGSITTTFTGGTGNISYSWSNGLTISSLTGVTAGTYTVTVTDDNNCIVTESIVVNEPDAINADMSYQNVSTPTSCDGTATATVTGGTSPYDYLWDDLALQTTQTAVGLCVGTYTVMITDVNGCTSTGSVMVDSIAMGIANGYAGSINVYPNPSGGVFTIELNVPVTKSGELQIVAVDGRVVYQETLVVGAGYTKTISLIEESKGVYFISLLTDDMVVNRRIVIK